MLKKVLSGGQSGADIAGLRAAKLSGFETGGTAPKGYRTQNGPNFELRDIYNLKEHWSWRYDHRTECNVKDSDATIKVASNFQSAGEKCTQKYINMHGRPSLEIDINNTPDPHDVVEWLNKNKVKVLNVAGNSEKTSPGIEEKAMWFLFSVFKKYKESIS